MLEEIDPAPLGAVLFRLANPSRERQLLESILTEPQDLAEALEFFSPNLANDELEELLDAPFVKYEGFATPYKPGRFSDGQWPVFYSALEATTAQAELQHHYKKGWTAKHAPLPYTYRLFQCALNGAVADVRPKLQAWPWLVAEDYTQCQALGAEVSKSSAECNALKSVSARKQDGTTVPVFERSVLSAPKLVGRVIFEADPATGEVKVTWTEHAE